MADIEVKEPIVPPEELLKFGTAPHRKLLARLQSRLRLSHDHISGRYDDWDRVDEHVRMFVDLSRKARRADTTEDPTKRELPFERAIVVPLSFTVLQVRVTALMAIFHNREPTLQLEGTGPEDVEPAKLMEAMMTYDMDQMLAPVVLYSLFQDADKYGMGVVYDAWEEEPGWVVKRPPPMPGVFGRIQEILRQRMGIEPPTFREWGTVREYNRWTPVDPFFFWPDPRVPVSRVDDMEFIGHRIYRGYMHLLERSVENDGPYFNVEKLPTASSKKRDERMGARDRFLKSQFGLREVADEKDKGFYGLDMLQIKLVPRDWGLSPVTKPEIWWFTMADESVVIRAHPSRYDHGKFTYAVAEPNFDYHSTFTPGMIESMDGLQRMMTWLFNSHVDNVRRFLNDALIYDPSLVEEVDILNPGAARHIRVTRKGSELLEAGQMTLQGMVNQLPISDVTRSHLTDMQVAFDMAQRMAAVNDPTMGQPTESRRTLGEVERIIFSAANRMATVARLYDAMALRPLSFRAIANRQQFTSLDQYVRIVGEFAREVGSSRLLVNRQKLQGNFDYIANTGVVSPDPARFAEIWVRVLQAVGRMGELLLTPGRDGKILDVQRVFKETARTLGIKNFDEFFVSVVPDAQVAAGVQAGNMVPPEQVELAGNGQVAGAGIQTPVVPVGVDLRGGGGA